MAQGYAAELIGVLDGTLNPAAKADGRLQGGTVRTYRAVLDMALATTAKNIADTNLIARIPRGEAVIGGQINASVTMGAAATIAIGNAAAPAKYRAAAVFTTPDAPTAFGIATAVDDAPLQAFEDVIMTIAAAALPGAGILVITLFTLGR